MRINGNNNNISFNKKLAATCCVMKSTGRQLPCSIYKISSVEDKYYFRRVARDYNWEKNHFLDCLNYDNENEISPETTIYSLEDKYGKCIGAAEITEKDSAFEIDILETAPKFENKRSDSSIKYIGETMVSFVTKLAEAAKKKMVVVHSSSNAVDFYSKHCHMNYNDKNKYFYLPAYKYGNLLLQNEGHTGKKINIVE